MTGKTSHTPIYTKRQLAEMVAQHDQEHPEHGNECPCLHGLITAARALFRSTPVPVRVPQFEPRPYVSPDVVRGTTAGMRR